MTAADWTYSFNEELWPATGGFTSRGEAAAAARHDDPEAEFWTGQMVQPGIPHLDADLILDQLACQMLDRVGEACEGWPDDHISAEGRAWLEDRINGIVQMLLRRERAFPTFFALVKTQRHEGRSS